MSDAFCNKVNLMVNITLSSKGKMISSFFFFFPEGVLWLRQYIIMPLSLPLQHLSVWHFCCSISVCLSFFLIYLKIRNVLNYFPFAQRFFLMPCVCQYTCGYGHVGTLFIKTVLMNLLLILWSPWTVILGKQILFPKHLWCFYPRMFRFENQAGAVNAH